MCIDRILPSPFIENYNNTQNNNINQFQIQTLAQELVQHELQILLIEEIEALEQEQYEKDYEIFENIKKKVMEEDIRYLQVYDYIQRTIIMNKNGILSIENISTNDNGYVRIVYNDTTNDLINIDHYDYSMTYYHTSPEIELALSLIGA